jgi:hypothetical protein
VGDGERPECGARGESDKHEGGVEGEHWKGGGRNRQEHLRQRLRQIQGAWRGSVPVCTICGTTLGRTIFRTTSCRAWPHRSGNRAHHRSAGRRCRRHHFRHRPS